MGDPAKTTEAPSAPAQPKRKAVTVFRGPLKLVPSVADTSVRLALQALDTVKRESKR